MRKHTHWLCAAFILAVAVSATAQEYTSRMAVLQNEELWPDFIVQGEYLAKFDGYDVGLHIIADGGGNFRVVGYPGGLPGAGWDTAEPRILGTAQFVVGEGFTFTAAEGSEQYIGTGELKGNLIGPEQGGRVTIEIPSMDIVFEKQNRQSPTLGGEPPAGAVVIFDGTNLNKFQEGARMNQPRRGGNTLWAEAATTAFEKKPYKMHLEFMLSYMPQARGQARSNSGVYIDERYELQVLDSFGLEGKDDECGGFYQLASPSVNMCFPPLTWQTYEIDFTPARWDGGRKIANARVSVKHNGVLIQDDLELPHHTPGRRNEAPEPLGVYFQGHGNQVQYRNIWVQYRDWPAVPPPAVGEIGEMREPMAEESAPPRRRPMRQQSQPIFPRLRALLP